jgi:hypothetical protein
MKEEILKAAKLVAKKSASKLTPELRNMASQAGWPSDIIIELSVKAKDENLYISYPEGLEDKVNNLEYGTPNTAPNAVIRPFTARMHKHLEQEVSESIIAILTDVGAFS